MADQPPGFSEYPRPNVSPGTGSYGRGPGIYFDAIGEAFNLVKQDLGQWIAGTVVYFALVFGFSFLTQIITNPIVERGSPFVGIGLQLALNIVAGGVETCVLVGLIAMGVRKSRGEYINVSMVFDPFKRFGSIFGTGLLYFLILYASIFACILPAFFFAPVLFLAPVVAFMLDLSPGQAISTTFNACKAHWAGLFGLSFVMGLVTILGACACLVGILVTFPIYCVVFGIHYRAFFESSQPTYQ